MEEIISWAECYVKGEESNAEKRARDAKEKGPEHKHYDIPPSRDRGAFKRQPERERQPRWYAS